MDGGTEPGYRPPEQRTYPCCRHCTHKNCQCDPPCAFEGHPMPCSSCAQYEAWVEFFGQELADLIDTVPFPGSPPENI